MIRALLITNPAAARTDQVALEVIRRTLVAGGWRVEVLATGGSGDARRLAEYGVLEKVDVVGVFGGDGTTMQAAAALVGTEVSLGILPGGTGNLLAGNLRIPLAPARAAESLLRSRPRRLDLGRIERPDGTHYFAVACGAGYDALVMGETAAENKRRWGIGAYIATTIRLMNRLRSVSHVITVDGVEYEAEASMVLVANCNEMIPPLVKLGHGISPDDGYLDVIVVRAENFTQSVRALWEVMRETDPTQRSEFVSYARGREIRIETTPIQPVQLDGEAGGVTPFTATVVPGALLVMAPPIS